MDFSVDLILPAALLPWGLQSLSQKCVSGILLGVKCGRRVRLTTSPPSVSRFSIKMWEPRRLTTLWASTACYRIMWYVVIHFILLFSFKYSLKQTYTKLKNLSPWPLVRKLTIPTERPPLVGEVSAIFCGYRVSRGQRNGPPGR
jgi:hypothetical protein